MDAVWAFVVEHCDITERGAYFVKFHASGRADFEKRVRARLKYGYHRIDDRTGFNNRQKEADATARRTAHESRKAAKKRQHTLSREKQKEAFAALEASRKMPLANAEPLSPVINMQPMQPLALPWYTRVAIWVKSNLKNRKSLNANTVPSLQKASEVSPSISNESMTVSRAR